MKPVFKRLIFLIFLVFSVSRCGNVITPFEADANKSKGPLGPIGNSMPFPRIRTSSNTQSSAYGGFQSQKFRGYGSVDTFSKGMMHGEQYRMVVAPTVLGGTAFVRQINNE